MVSSPMSAAIQHLRSAVLRDGAGGTDGELLECFVSQRDDAALAALVRRHGPMVWGLCRRLLHSHHDAEDAWDGLHHMAEFKVPVAAQKKLMGENARALYGIEPLMAVEERIEEYAPAILPW